MTVYFINKAGLKLCFVCATNAFGHILSRMEVTGAHLDCQECGKEV